MVIEAIRDPSSAPFFEAAARGELVVRICPTCDRRARPETVCCLECAYEPLGWTAVSGRATLVSWAVVHPRPSTAVAPSTPSSEATVPVVLAIVELEEGPWLHTRLFDVDPASAHVGLVLQVAFVASGAEQVPVFQGVTGAGGG